MMFDNEQQPRDGSLRISIAEGERYGSEAINHQLYGTTGQGVHGVTVTHKTINSKRIDFAVKRLFAIVNHPGVASQKVKQALLVSADSEIVKLQSGSAIGSRGFKLVLTMSETSGRVAANLSFIPEGNALAAKQIELGRFKKGVFTANILPTPVRNRSSIKDLEITIGDSKSGLIKDVADLENTVGDSKSGLVKAVGKAGTLGGDDATGLHKSVAWLTTALFSLRQNTKQIYSGWVSYEGTGWQLPHGWTSEKKGKGYYRVHHNMKHDKIMPMVVTPIQSFGHKHSGEAAVDMHQDIDRPSYYSVYTMTRSGNAADFGFSFIVTVTI